MQAEHTIVPGEEYSVKIGTYGPKVSYICELLLHLRGEKSSGTQRAFFVIFASHQADAACRCMCLVAFDEA